MRTAPPPLRPARFYVVPSIPRLPNSKLDIQGLTALDEARAQYEREEPIAEVEHASIVGDHLSQVLARAWQDVLGVPVRGGEEDFFDSGGDSLKAIALVLELERTLGFEISLTLINETPRFDQLCQALRERRPPGSTPLVTLKAGDSLPPVFFIHGVGGNVMMFLPTARQVTYPGAVIGIRARGVVRGEAPHASIEAMATDYLREIKACQPNGPYYLCGYSSGGLVAFEIARRLSESGDDVGLVGLFDTRISSVRRPLRAWLSIANPRLAARRLRAWRDTFTGAPFNAVSVVARSFIAAAKYHPGFYRGQLTLFAPAEREPSLPSLESTWRAHARTIVVVETAGTHSTMLSASNAECAAASLTRCLRVCSAAIPTGVDLANAVAHAR
jgi:thioesterase domain-containing protein/acyl carrier protein